MHRDIKPQNVLLTSKSAGSTVKLADFGSSRSMVRGRDMTQAIGTVAYLPPEYMMSAGSAGGTGGVNGMHWDTYSFAILLAFLFTERPPYKHLHNDQTCIQVSTHPPRSSLRCRTHTKRFVARRCVTTISGRPSYMKQMQPSPCPMSYPRWCSRCGRTLATSDPPSVTYCHCLKTSILDYKVYRECDRICMFTLFVFFNENSG